MKIIPATPYADVARFQAKGASVKPTSPGVAGSGRPSAPSVRTAAAHNSDSLQKRFNIIVREAKKRGFRTLTDMQKWAERELRTGGYLEEYLRREKAQGVVRQRAVARKYADRKRHLKGDFELQAAVPAREFFRWRKQDPHFWEDKSNLKSLKRDNPDMLIFA